MTTGTAPPQTLTYDGESGRVDASRFFTDPEGDPITYAAGPGTSVPEMTGCGAVSRSGAGRER